MKKSSYRWSVIALATIITIACVARQSKADAYDDMWTECNYITQCSATSANASCASLANTKPMYGILNDWRIGNGQADFVKPGEAAMGSIGLLYGYHRLQVAGRSNSSLDTRAKTALSGFFWSWVRNTNNMVGSGFPQTINYTSAGDISSKDSAANAGVTAELLIAMRKYCLYSPNGDGASYQSQEYSLAHSMADYVNANLSTWTIDRSYAVAAFRAFGNWASAVGDSGTSSYYINQANTVSGWLTGAQDPGGWHNYYSYLDGAGHGVYNNNIVDQTGFAPYEFNARPLGEAYAKGVADWWNTGSSFNNVTLTQQSGAYIGGVHQETDKSALYAGSALQLADAEWKIAGQTGNYNNLYASAWSHYNFARSGSTLWNTSGSQDCNGIAGGFVDWIEPSTGAKPTDCFKRFVDTSAYFLIATEELQFSNQVDFSN